MPKFEPLPPVSGADALLSLLDALKNPQAVEARVKELVTLRDEINASIAIVGKVEDVEALHHAGLEDRRKASEVLRVAKETAAETTRVAFSDRDAALAEVVQMNTALAEARKAIESEKLSWERARGDREAALRVMEDEIRGARDKAVTHETDAAALKSEWTEKMGRLRAAGVN